MNKDNNENVNIAKSLILILLIIVLIVGFLMYNGTIKNPLGKNINKSLDTNPLSCKYQTTSEWTVMGNTIINEETFEKNMTFNEKGNVDTIEFIGLVKYGNQLSYDEVKNSPNVASFIDSECDSYGMKVNKEFIDQKRVFKAVCKEKFANIQWQDNWKISVGMTREEIKRYYTNDEYTCN